MIPAAFDYSAPSTLEEALKLLQEIGDEAKILAGGHSLIPMMKLRFAEPEHLIDLGNIPDLSYIRIEDDFLKIGAMTREVEMEEARNFGTLGGNLAHGDAANDHPAVMIALNAEIEITNLEGKRTVSIDEFFYGFYMTAVQEGEILTEIRIPLPEGKFGNAYHKTERKVGDYATGGVAVQLILDNDGTCTAAGIGLTNVNPTPFRAERSEKALVGTKVDEKAIEAAAQYASEDCSPSSDLRGDEEYKRRVIKTLTKRMIQKALERAQG
ncbi:MAG: xanthine dehydrogenase family protein subunit M [Cyclobacteriaceae bacterium]